MKTLIVIRHAKSSWRDLRLADSERPLKKRGRRNAVEMAKRYCPGTGLPDLVACSPARRARETAALMAAAPWLSGREPVIDDQLYTFDVAVLWTWLRGLDRQINSALIFGHNPALTNLVNQLAGESLANLPTCGIAELELGIDCWAEAVPGCARLLALDYPKRSDADSEHPQK